MTDDVIDVELAPGVVATVRTALDVLVVDDEDGRDGGLDIMVVEDGYQIVADL